MTRRRDFGPSVLPGSRQDKSPLSEGGVVETVPDGPVPPYGEYEEMLFPTRVSSLRPGSVLRKKEPDRSVRDTETRLDDMTVQSQMGR